MSSLRTLGPLSVSPLGFGCMGLSEFYGPAPDEDAALALLDQALELGVSLFDTADVYGRGHNERLVGRFLARHRAAHQQQRFAIATKAGILREAPGQAYQRGVSSDPAYLRQACDDSLQRLGVECIDLFYLHRVAPDAILEDSIGALARLVEAGKVRALGLCEVSASTLRHAHAVHPISAVQMEYSLWTRDAEHDILPTCRALGVGLVAYSPLGRGFLTGTVRQTESLAHDDFRRISPRFQGDAFAQNISLLQQLESLAARHHATPGQIALAWLLAQGADIVPIPGTKRPQYLAENVAAGAITLSPADLAWLDQAFPRGAAHGNRYPDEGMKTLNT